MEFFVKIVKVFQLLTIFAKSSVFDIWLGSNYTSGTCNYKPQYNLINNIAFDDGNYKTGIVFIIAESFSKFERF